MEVRRDPKGGDNPWIIVSKDGKEVYGRFPEQHLAERNMQLFLGIRTEG